MGGPPADIEELALQVVRTLRKANYVAYFAGGCVRDRLLQRIPKDYDVATSAMPEEVRELFGRKRTIAVGASFGVITVLGPKSVGQIEVATFRNDGEYSDGRHPDHVEFSSPEQDALRRDFTINGMFFDPIENEVIDYVDGQADLQRKVVNAIGDPTARIHEDRLRMLRAVRFASTLGFSVEARTMAAVKDHAPEIHSVSRERITHEVQRMLLHSNRARALELLRESRLLPHVLPEMIGLAQQAPKWQHLRTLLDHLRNPDFPTILAALFGTQGAHLDATTIESVCRRLKTSNDVRKAAIWIAASESLLREGHQLRFSQLQPLLVHDQIHSALQLATSIVTVAGLSLEGVQACERKLGLPPEKLDPPRLIRGGDLAEVGGIAGPRFAEALQLVRDAQLDGQVSDRDDALQLVRHWIQST